MKKLFSILMSFVFVLSLGTVAFAEEVDSITPVVYEDMETVDLAKVYKLINDGYDNPAETFKFTIEKFSVSDSPYTLATMPMFDPATFEISFIEGEATIGGDTNTETLNLPDYDYVGIFTYKITETIGDTAGVTYDANPLYLKVTVIEQDGKVRVVALHYALETGEKMEKLTNTYAAGSLEVSKMVTGNLGDKSKFFEVVVTLFAPTDKVVRSTIDISGGSYATNPTEIVIGAPTSFWLKDGETITFDNLPYGVTYTVVEADYTGEPDYYITTHTFSDPDDKLINSLLDTVEIENNKNRTVDTGISLDSLPYVLLIGFAGLGMGVLLFKKRHAF